MHIELTFVWNYFGTEATEYKLGINFCCKYTHEHEPIEHSTIRVMCHSIHPLCLLTFEYRQSSMKYLSSAWIASLHSKAFFVVAVVVYQYTFHKVVLYEIISTQFDDDISIEFPDFHIELNEVWNNRIWIDKI